MKIVFQHDGILPVLEYGGIERMLYWHMLELIKQGHEVVLIGHPSCNLTGTGIELIPMNEENWYSQIPDNADVLQLFYNYEPPIDIPTINTIGGNGKIGEKFLKNTAFVSRKHAQLHGSDSYVYNAIDLNEYPFQPSPSDSWDNFLFLAKGSWSVKNLKHCIKACKKSEKHLHIAGGKALLPSKYIHNHGMVGGDKKLEIIRSTDALLFPIRWPEPFGLAIIEAMSQGKPVIGSNYGALPELINKDTGIICKSYEDLLNSVQLQRNEFDSNKIREYVEDNFGIEKFTTSYIELFKRVCSGEVLNETQPSFNGKEKAETLLPF